MPMVFFWFQYSNGITYNRFKTKKALHFCKALSNLWTHKGSNLGPPDYESGALTN